MDMKEIFNFYTALEVRNIQTHYHPVLHVNAYIFIHQPCLRVFANDIPMATETEKNHCAGRGCTFIYNRLPTCAPRSHTCHTLGQSHHCLLGSPTSFAYHRLSACTSSFQAPATFHFASRIRHATTCVRGRRASGEGRGGGYCVRAYIAYLETA